MRSTSPKPMSSTRPTSLMAARAPRVPKVMICATCSRPYFSVTYWITSPRPRVQKSMSISGMRDALRIQEALEQQAVGERIDVGDLHRVADQAAGGGTAARAHRDAALLGEADEIPDDQEVAGELHLLDHLDFAIQALGVLGEIVLQVALALPALPGARGVFRIPGARRIRRSCRWCDPAESGSAGTVRRPFRA